MMNWLFFALATYLTLVVETGLRATWMLPIAGGMTPALLLVLLVFIGLHAPTWTVIWAGLVLGLVADLQSSPMPETLLIGPTTLGYLAAAYTVLQLRSMVFRQSLLTLVALVLAAGLFAEGVTVAMLTVRSWSWTLGQPIPGWSAADQLVHRFLELIYTSAVALPLGVLLFRTTRLWGFAPRNERRF